MIESSFYSLILVVSLGLIAQGAFNLSLMTFSWWQPTRLAATRSPTKFLPPAIRYTVLLPARHEQQVIGHTIRRVWACNYPKDLLEVVVICEHQDTETIAEARAVIEEINHPNLRIVVFSDGVINKPHGLNVGFRASSHGVVTIFDAEDDVHPDIFQVVNTIMRRDGASIVQAGVQLMDFRSSWFAVHNVLEYFFWFKSRLHFHAQMGMIPLGGNTVFMQRRLIEAAGGWDERCLTEDADIGITLSVLGEKITVTYDPEHVTREEAPPTVSSFVRQRTRWNQGFLQVLRKGRWGRFPSLSQRLLAVYTLTYPFAQAAIGILWPAALLMILLAKVPVPIAMLSFVPLYGFLFQFVANVVGLMEFTSTYRTRLDVRDVLRLTLGFLPYQVLLSVSAIRAVYREMLGMTNWEKTAHRGAHRTADGLAGVRVAVPHPAPNGHVVPAGTASPHADRAA